MIFLKSVWCIEPATTSCIEAAPVPQVIAWPWSHHVQPCPRILATILKKVSQHVITHTNRGLLSPPSALAVRHGNHIVATKAVHALNWNLLGYGQTARATIHCVFTNKGNTKLYLKIQIPVWWILLKYFWVDFLSPAWRSGKMKHCGSCYHSS